MRLKPFAILGLVIAWTAGAAAVRAQDMPQKEHDWLKQFIGEWESEGEVFLEPGKPPLKWKGPESARAVGGFWVVSEGKADFLGQPMTSLRTLGYDPAKKKYVATSVGSFSSHLWTYEGTLDAAGKVLTLEAEGPSPAALGTLCKWRDTVEFKDKDHRVFTNAVQVEGGNWQTVVVVNSRRKK
jgi:hypothetical protein